MSAQGTRFIACFSFGTGAGFDLQLAANARQLAEDFSDILALLDNVVAIPRTLLIPQGELSASMWERRASAFAVFYSLPDTSFLLRSASNLGADCALTGRIIDTEGSLILSVNLLDVQRRVLLFSGQEECAREAIPEAIVALGSKLLTALDENKAKDWIPALWAMLGTRNFRAYTNWLGYRECIRRAAAQNQPQPSDRMLEHLVYALKDDPHYQKALRALPQALRAPLSTRSLDLAISQLSPLADNSETIALSLAWVHKLQGQNDLGCVLLDRCIAKHPEAALLYLMRSICKKAKDPGAAQTDASRARELLGEEQFSVFLAALDT